MPCPIWTHGNCVSIALKVHERPVFTLNVEVLLVVPQGEHAEVKCTTPKYMTTNVKAPTSKMRPLNSKFLI